MCVGFAMCGRQNNGLQRRPCPNSQTYKYVTLCGKRYFAGGPSDGEHIPGLVRWAQHNHKGP